MSNWMKSTKSWLGLGAEPYYEDEYEDSAYEGSGYEDEHQGNSYDEPPVQDRPAVRAVPHAKTASRSVSSVSPIGSDDWEEGDGGVRVMSSVPEPVDSPRGVVRSLPTSAKPFVVSPTGFNDVQQVADRFRRNQPVIVNMQGLDRDLSRRLIDFSSGLCYGLEGDMERVADQVFLLTPHGAEVSDDERRRIREGDLDEGH